MNERMYQQCFEKLTDVINENIGISVEEGGVIVRGCVVSTDPMLVRLVEQHLEETELRSATEKTNRILREAQAEHNLITKRIEALQEKVIANKAFFKTHGAG